MPFMSVLLPIVRLHCHKTYLWSAGIHALALYFLSRLTNHLPRTLAEELQELATKLQNDPPLQIDVRRSHVLEDSMREAKKKKFTVSREVQVNISQVFFSRADGIVSREK